MLQDRVFSSSLIIGIPSMLIKNKPITSVYFIYRQIAFSHNSFHFIFLRQKIHFTLSVAFLQNLE